MAADQRNVRRLDAYRVLTFDCYGTLIDWESGIRAALSGLIGRTGRDLSRNAVLETHARHESAQQAQTPAMPYRQILSVVYRRLAEEWGVPASFAEAEEYGGSVGNWPAFPDTVEALRYLKKFYRLVILSNVDNESFSRTLGRLGVAFDAVYTAEDVGSYKPSPRNIDYMLGHLAGLGIERSSILHTAESLFHDHGPANGAGLASCWIHRRHAQPGFGATVDPGAMPRIDFRFTSMAAMAEAHRAEQACGP